MFLEKIENKLNRQYTLDLLNPAVSGEATGGWDAGSWAFRMAQRDASFEADNAESRDGDASQKLRYRDNVMFIGERMVTE